MQPTIPAMTTDYATSEGCPEPYLRRISEAGFRHIHWCHHWCTDFLYDDGEIDQIARWLAALDLKLNDLHGSHGREKAWGSPRPYEREAGVALVRNRIEMAHRLHCDVVIVHIPLPRDDEDGLAAYWERWEASLDALEPVARSRGVRIALENSPDDNMDIIAEAFSRYGPDFLGLCYDTGHGAMAGNGLDRLADHADRLISLHLHDNDGATDQHRVPFTGIVDWDRLAAIVAASSYTKPAITLECVMRNSPITEETDFLATAAEAGSRFAAMVDDERAAR